jgi:predicted outer membrane repeat protein
MRMARVLWSCCLVLVAVGVAGAAPKTIYVDKDSPGAEDGTSWTNAFIYLQDALAVSTAGDTIRVAQGTYRPNQGTGPTPSDRTATFQLKTGVGLYGGYAGYGTVNPNKRDVALYKTILSGDLDGNDVTTDINDVNQVYGLLTAPTRQDNAYTVVSGNGVEPNAVLDGFTITGGNANGPQEWPFMYARGGGLFSYGNPPHYTDGSPTVRNCTFTANSASYGGGAISNYQNKALIENCTIRGNFGKEYGAGVTNWASDSTYKNCKFIRNGAYGSAEGGALYCYDSNPHIQGCTFTENYGGQEGGGLYAVYSDPVVEDCNFARNFTSSYGGAVGNSTGSYPKFARCIFIGNTAGDWGGAMTNYSATPTLTDCVFSQNSSTGGAGGAVYNRYSEPTLVNCLFTHNSAYENGGAVSNYNTDVRLINCTFAANTAVDGGRAVACDETSDSSTKSHVTITNCILWDDGHEIFQNLGDASQIDVTYSDVKGGWTGAGNISADPKLDELYQIQAHSPCIDAGANFAVPIDVTEDLAGNARFIDDLSTADTGNGTPPVVDMGAYEYQGGIPGPGNHAPVANAGPNQTVVADDSGFAVVTLDGSGSYDVDGDFLTYRWTWTVNSNSYLATGVHPVLQLPVGQHTISLRVYDGTVYSTTDQVVITVTDQPVAMDAEVQIYPYQITRFGTGQYVYAVARLFNVHANEVDLNSMLTITPGNVQAFQQDATQNVDASGVSTTIVALFWKSALTAAIPQNGVITLTVSGQLKSGQAFSGTDSVKLSNN